MCIEAMIRVASVGKCFHSGHQISIHTLAFVQTIATYLDKVLVAFAVGFGSGIKSACWSRLSRNAPFSLSLSPSLSLAPSGRRILTRMYRSVRASLASRTHYRVSIARMYAHVHIDRWCLLSLARLEWIFAR
jgi:hypothetical protein